MVPSDVRSTNLVQMGKLYSSILPLLAFVCVLLSATTVPAEELYVAAASDLIYAFQKMEKPFGDAYGVKIKWIFGSSGMLSTQIQGGLPVDAFASASPDWVDRLQEKELVVEKGRKVFALGRIALCTHKESNVIVGKIEDLVTPKIGRISIANPSHAPYGVAAKEALEKVGISEKVKSKLVYGENVLQAQTHIRRGEVDAAIIALSLTEFPEMRCFALPPDLHNPIRQTIAILKESKKKELAQKFVDFLEGKEGLLILEKYGFLRP
jgi:molybdate transport system substrate-binding protein